MLTTEEVQAILDKFADQKKAPAAKPKKGEEVKDEGKLQARKSALESKATGAKVFFTNKGCDKDNILKNDGKPFYVATLQKIDGEDVSLTLTPEELAEPDGVPADFKKPGFKQSIVDTLDYSAMTEEGCDDMVDIDELNSATLLYNLANRYKREEMEIYTWVGPILLALNPFKRCPHYEGQEFENLYRRITDPNFSPVAVKKELRPHTNAISAMAYAKLKSDQIRQAIVISGESGSGKTESAKIAMNFLTLLSQGSGPKPEPVAGEEVKKDIGDRILACNPILEGFGNSKTSRNDNSSRFGKYVKMYFGLYEDKVFGAVVRNYLLEKSRVIMVAKKERGYHIFYFMLRGAPKEVLEKCKLLDPKTKEGYLHMHFNYLAGGGDYVDQTERERWTAHDIEGFNDVQGTMNDLGFEPEFQMGVWRINAACLHLGQIEWDPKSFDDPTAPSKRGVIKNPEQVELIAGLLGIEDWKQLETALLAKSMVMQGKTIWTDLGEKACKDNRDALAKQIYYQMFDWLVKKMNTTIQPDELYDPSFGQKAKTIGLLDIFGFENFADPSANKSGNNFEQLCINYVNEKLHKLYISAIFEAEKKELKEEGLGERTDDIKFESDVNEIISLIDYHSSALAYKGIKYTPAHPAGIFPAVDDMTKGKAPNAKEIGENFKKSYAKYCPTLFEMNMKRKDQFRIKHSAEAVWYDHTEFVIRDVDSIPDALEACMSEYSCKEVRYIYQVLLDEAQEQEMIELKAAASKRKGPAKTIWGSFSKQMDNLMEEMAEALLKMGGDNSQPIPEGVEPTELHFIRCIKPRPKPLNKTDRPGLFVYTMTLQQITYMGVLESVELKQKNFPFRKKFIEFYQEYELLSPRFSTIRFYQMNKDTEDFDGLSKQIVLDSMKGLGTEFYANGNTKILMMPETKEILDKCKLKASASRNKAADFLKKAFCTFYGAKSVDKQRENIVATQKKYKIRYQLRQQKYIAEFKVNFDDAITKYKAEKNKVLEIKSVVVLKDVLAKHLFRNQMERAMAARDTVAKTSFNAAYLQRITKYMISNILATRVVHNAFTRAREKINGHNVWHVQRAFRGFMLTSTPERKESMANAIQQKKELKFEISAKKIQKYIKGLTIRRRIAFLDKTASFIQSYFRMRWCRQVYIMIRRNVKILQRAYRKYMARRDQIKLRLKSYLTQEFTVINNVREMEQFQLFGDDQDPDLLKHHSPYGIKKIFLFNRIVDLHIITDLSDVYNTPWAAQWMQIYKDGIQAEKPMMQLSVGASHSIACNGKGQLYVWGWNDSGQCTIDTELVDEIVVRSGSQNALIDLERQMNQDVHRREEDKPSPFSIKARQLITVEDRTFVLTQDTNELIAWGGNERGQLGLGHYSDVHIPEKIDFFSRPGQKVSSIAGGGDLTLACTESGDSYAWPFVKNGQKYSNPVRMPFSEKINIARVSCGYNFGFFISSQGLVYSVGKDNSDGQLGLGHVYPNDIPELVCCFKEAGERIDSIECGFRHAIARSTLGKVYTWGWNKFGQLGHDHFDSELSPRLLKLERGKLNKDKAVQIAAGYSHTVIMTATANFEILHFGTSGSMSKQATPIPLNLSEKLSSMFPDNASMMYATGQQTDFAVVKVTCTWSKSLSLTNLMIADLRAVNEHTQLTKLQNSVAKLAEKWDQREIMPPWIEPISGFFSATVMRKPSGRTQTRTSGVNTKANNPLNKKAAIPKQPVTSAKKKPSYTQATQDKVMGKFATTHRSEARNPLTQSVLSQDSPHVPASGRSRR